MKSNYILLMLFFSVTACGDGGNDDDDNFSQSTQSENVLTTPSAGRLLASQCAQCHGTDGISVSGIESLAGESDEILEEMSEMKSENRNRVMHLQTKGYSASQIREIANYFSSLYSGKGNAGGGNENDDRDNDRDGDDDRDNDRDGDDDRDNDRDGDDDRDNDRDNDRDGDDD